MEPTVELIRQCIIGLYQAVVVLSVLFLANVVLCLALSVKLVRMSRDLKSLTDVAQGSNIQEAVTAVNLPRNSSAL